MPDVQSPLLDAIHLAGRYAAPAAAAEVHSDVCGAYHAHATTRFPEYKYALELDVTNLLFLSHPTVFCSHPGCYFLVNRRDPQFGPWLSLTN